LPDTRIYFLQGVDKDRLVADYEKIGLQKSSQKSLNDLEPYGSKSQGIWRS
jgi:hypothetical protein